MPADPPERCPCQSDTDDPGPHIASCPWSDLEYGTEAFETDMAEMAATDELRDMLSALAYALTDDDAPERREEE